MAGTSEIKNRIKGIQNTQKITNAMYLIASMKMQKAKRELDLTRPYFDAVSTEIKRIFRTAEKVTSHYFFPPEGEPALTGAHGLLVVTADKGLAGAYNQNVLKLAELALRQFPDTRLFVVGEYGRQYFMRKKVPIEKNFLYTAQNPTKDRAREIASFLLDEYDHHRVEHIHILYTDLRGGIISEAKRVRILPFRREPFLSSKGEEEEMFEFFPSERDVLEALVPSYMSGFIYSALVDSFCAEQSARMTAMSSANDNAEKILDELSMELNRVRQSAITQEITEIAAGAAAAGKKEYS